MLEFSFIEFFCNLFFIKKTSIYWKLKAICAVQFNNFIWQKWHDHVLEYFSYTCINVWKQGVAGLDIEWETHQNMYLNIEINRTRRKGEIISGAKRGYEILSSKWWYRRGKVNELKEEKNFVIKVEKNVFYGVLLILCSATSFPDCLTLF